MPLTTCITVRSQIVRTPRVMQVEGLFDLPTAAEAVLHWDVSLPLEEKPWHIGLIVGPSGCGKSTVARQLFGAALAAQEALPAWPEDRAVLDAFPAEMPVKDIVTLLSSVGLSSPPAWLRPFRVLSTGEQFRVSLARLLAFAPELAVMDEYTSVVDRTVARIGSAALAKTVRRRGGRFIAVTCHEDVADWLQPDWVYRPAVNGFTWRCLQRRPEIQLAISRADRRLWRLFRAHHYLSTALAPAAVCFVARWHERPVAFSAWITVPGSRTKREHRSVVLPDYQGVGLGHALSGFCAALWKALGYRVTSTTTHPAFVAARQRSPDWRLRRPPSLGRPSRGRWAHLRHATTRLTAGFEYVGPALDPLEARALLLVDRRTPKEDKTMSRIRLTSPMQKLIVGYIRLGCYDWLAAEATGVPREVFSDWLRRGQAGARAYRELALQVLQAKAQARASAEMAAFKLNPLSWLRYGPGRETDATPGWTVSVRPLVTAAQANALESVPVLELLQALDHALRGHPEAREAVLQVLDRLPSQTSIRSRRKNKGEAS